MARRANGEGSLYQRKKDGRWCGAIPLGMIDGKPQRKVFYGKTRKEVADKLKAAQKQLDMGVRIKTDRQTVAAFISSWLDAIQDTVRPATYISYESTSRRHIVPMLGHYQIAQLTAPDVVAWVKACKAKNLAPTTIARMLVTLKAALTTAVEWRLIAFSPAAYVHAPRIEPRDVPALTKEDLYAFLVAARGEQYGSALVLILLSGLRHGEATGLMWSDVDWQAGTIRVQRSLSWIRGHAQFAEPKTKRSARTVAVPTVVMDLLRQHRRGSLDPAALIFTSRVGTPIAPTVLRQGLRHILEKAGLPRLRVHDLRHAYASLLLSQNVHPKFVQEAMGHATISMTMDRYSHSLPSSQNEVVGPLEALLTVVEV